MLNDEAIIAELRQLLHCAIATLIQKEQYPEARFILKMFDRLAGGLHEQKHPQAVDTLCMLYMLRYDERFQNGDFAEAEEFARRGRQLVTEDTGKYCLCSGELIQALIKQNKMVEALDACAEAINQALDMKCTRYDIEGLLGFALQIELDNDKRPDAIIPALQRLARDCDISDKEFQREWHKDWRGAIRELRQHLQEQAD